MREEEEIRSHGYPVFNKNISDEIKLNPAYEKNVSDYMICSDKRTIQMCALVQGNAYTDQNIPNFSTKSVSFSLLSISVTRIKPLHIGMKIEDKSSSHRCWIEICSAQHRHVIRNAKTSSAEVQISRTRCIAWHKQIRNTLNDRGRCNRRLIRYMIMTF